MLQILKSNICYLVFTTNTRYQIYDSRNLLHLKKVWNISEHNQNQSRYRLGVAQRVPGSYGSQISWQWHGLVVRLSASCTGCLYRQEMLLVLISVRGWVDPRAMVRSEGFYVNEKFQWHQLGFNQRPSDLWHRTLTTVLPRSPGEHDSYTNSKLK